MMGTLFATTSALIILLGLLYVSFMGWCALGWHRLLLRRHDPDSIDVPIVHGLVVSVIVPARNEAERIRQCLDSILECDYPDECREVIVVDDGSTDGTGSIVRRRYAREIAEGSLCVIMIERGAGKRSAIEAGVAAARGRYILTTDADCTVAPGWIAAMTSELERGAPVVAGPVAYRHSDDDSPFARLQALEFAGLVAVGAGSMANGLPTICNSANLGYTRSIHRLWARRSGTELGAQAGNAAGADETIVLHARELSGSPSVFVLDRSAVVSADPSVSIAEFASQRIRWASMGGRYPRFHVVAISALVFGFYAALVFAPAAGLWEAWLGAVGLKVAGDALLLAPSVRFFGARPLLRLFAVGQLVHAPYVIGAATWGALVPTRWKDRLLDGSAAK